MVTAEVFFSLITQQMASPWLYHQVNQGIGAIAPLMSAQIDQFIQGVAHILELTAGDDAILTQLDGIHYFDRVCGKVFLQLQGDILL